VKKFSAVDSYLDEMPTFSHFKDRVDYFSKPKKGGAAAEADLYGNILSSVLNGTHVFIVGRNNLRIMLTFILKETGNCNMVNINDYRNGVATKEG
jgi:hypothetical protein